MEQLSKYRMARRAYGLDEIALVPDRTTVDVDDVDISATIGSVKLAVPIIGSAMDGVVDARMAVHLSELGAVGVLNLHGVQTRYENPDAVLEKIASVSTTEYVELMQKIYQEPVKEFLIAKRIKEIKSNGGYAVGSTIPQDAVKFGQLVAKAGGDALLVQSTVVSVEHFSARYNALDLEKLAKDLSISVWVGNCTTYDTALSLMKTGVSAVFVGVGPGAACTSRGVLGIGVPMATAIADAAAARTDFLRDLRQSSSHIRPKCLNKGQ
ncbi:MAG: IMP dehydrogenase, partial [Candidatus Margulisiibacteriota bacterium]